MIPTPHIEAKSSSEIARTVLMPGDPLRAEFIAREFLENPLRFNNVRGIQGYTGTYQGSRISVMASGIGMPSIGIYSYELFSFYEVERIIRIGSCGSYTPDLELYDVVLVEDCWSESTYARTQYGETADILPASESINAAIEKIAVTRQVPLRKERVHSSDVFYRERFEDYIDIRDTHGCKAVEMESFALFANAKLLSKEAACLLTVSDSLIEHAAISSDARQSSLLSMIEISLELSSL